MDERYSQSINSLKKKIEILISNFESVKEENTSLRSELEVTKQNLLNKNNKIKELEQKIDKLQLVDAFKSSADDVRDAKFKIGKLVREIDKCISLIQD